LKIVRLGDEFPKRLKSSILLRIPKPLEGAFLNELEVRGYKENVFLASGKVAAKHHAWLEKAMDRADGLLFWFPENSNGTTTQMAADFAWQAAVRRGDMVLGCAERSPNLNRLKELAKGLFLPIASRPSIAVEEACKMVGKGALRKGGECSVPLYLWKVPHFKQWLDAQQATAVGNKLEHLEPRLTFRVGPRGGFLLFWGARVEVYVREEDRIKANEIVVGRPDIHNVVAFYRPKGTSLADTEVVLVKEFRSPSTTEDGFNYGLPGGSSEKIQDTALTAMEELSEETQVSQVNIDPKRFQLLPLRQVAGTASTMRAYAHVIELRKKEIDRFRNLKPAGKEEETERTYPGVYRVGDLLQSTKADWSQLGMILATLVGDGA